MNSRYYGTTLTEDNAEEMHPAEGTKIEIKRSMAPPWEIHLKCMLVSITLLNPLCTPVLWYILRGYRQRWRDGQSTEARSYMIHALIIFSLGIFLTTFTIVALLICGLSGRPQNNLPPTMGTILTTGGTEERPVMNRTEVITLVNISTVLEETQRRSKQPQPPDKVESKPSLLTLDTLNDAKIRFRNRTFIQICSQSSGRCANLDMSEKLALDKT